MRTGFAVSVRGHVVLPDEDHVVPQVTSKPDGASKCHQRAGGQRLLSEWCEVPKEIVACTHGLPIHS